MSTVQVTDATFDDVVLGSSVPVVVDYWATWCAPCRQVAPLLDQLSQEYDGRLLVAKVDADSNPLAVSRAGVVSIPTLSFVVDGQVVDTIIGARPKPEIAAAIEAVLAKAAR
ncbi:MAG: thioredoxin [Cellulomonas sp.]|nr:thioredoxin [Cellulomonas sp.]